MLPKLLLATALLVWLPQPLLAAQTCDHPDVVAQTLTRDSLDNPFSSARLIQSYYTLKSFFTFGQSQPFGKPEQPIQAIVGQDSVSLIAPHQLDSLNPAPSGWFHQTGSNPSNYQLTTLDGQAAIQGSTQGGASILFRHTDIDLNHYPILHWQWRVDHAVDTPLCDHLSDGDDKSARLFISGRNQHGQRRWLEIVWANHLTPGERIYVHGFPHYVAAGPKTPQGTWVDQQLNLQTIFSSFWPEEQLVQLRGIGFMVDGDNSNSSVSAALANVSLHPAN